MARRPNMKIVLSLLSDGEPRSVKDISCKTGIDIRGVRTTLTNLKREGFTQCSNGIHQKVKESNMKHKVLYQKWI